MISANARHNCKKPHEIRTYRIFLGRSARLGDTTGDTESEKPPLPGEPRALPHDLRLMRRVVKPACRPAMAVYWDSEFVRDGGLLSYGVDQVDLFRRAATYVDRILRGAKPGELPVQFPTKFETVVNRKTATALGLSIPPSIMLRADEQVE